MKFAVLAALAAPALVAGQAYGPPPGPSDSSSSAASSASSSAAPLPSAAPGQHFIQVSPNNAFIFSPNNLTGVQTNQSITFLFPTTGGFQHSITQSSFANPCTPLANGFDSGLVSNNEQFTITITNASMPIWFYCKQTNPIKHCGQGMVGGINVPQNGTNTIESFTSAAKAIGDNEPPQTASGGLSGVGAVATAPASSTTISAAPASSGSNKPNGAAQLVVASGSMLTGLFAMIFTLA